MWAGGQARRRRALVRLHRRQPAQPRRARRAAARASASSSRSARSRLRRVTLAPPIAACVSRVHPCALHCLQHLAAAAHACAGLAREDPDMPMPAQPFLPFALPEIGEDEIAEVVDTLRSGLDHDRAEGEALRGRLQPPSSATRRCTRSPSTRPPPACTWRSRRSASARATRSSRPPTPSPPPPRWCATSAPTWCWSTSTRRRCTSTRAPSRRRSRRAPRRVIPVHYGGLAADMAATAAASRAAHGLQGGRGRRARAADHLRRPPGRHARLRRDGVQLLRQQDDHHRRGRHGRDARRRRWPSASGRCACTA